MREDRHHEQPGLPFRFDHASGVLSFGAHRGAGNPRRWRREARVLPPPQARGHLESSPSVVSFSFQSSSSRAIISFTDGLLREERPRRDFDGNVELEAFGLRIT